MNYVSTSDKPQTNVSLPQADCDDAHAWLDWACTFA